ncbi:hypothetical protein KBC75_03200 [Candidatus Shapirobacteria bacterium]|nr:hypothetical protein [Candidatus Shapirobacteria bacterium]
MTQNDLKLIQKIVREELKANNQVIDVKIKNSANEVEEKLTQKMLNWKSEMFNAMETFMIETKDQREFRIIGSHQINLNTQRIEVLEKKVFGGVTQV